MSKKETGGPAFPVPGLQDDEEFNGMTLRDYFAAKAPKPADSFQRLERNVQQIVEGASGTKRIVMVTEYEAMSDYLARWAYVYADAMIAERAK